MLLRTFVTTLVIATCWGRHVEIRKWAAKEPRAAYTAAVVEFSPAESGVPSLIMSVNVAEYLDFIAQVKTEGADIVVFPEYGLTGTAPSELRSFALDASQIIPAPETNINPCSQNLTAFEHETIRRLSCAAAEHGIYVVVNLIEREPCEACSADNFYLYNSNVAFDRQGTVAGRYRKWNLYAEYALNITSEPEISYFDTDFGARIGMITCFDLIFEVPAVSLIRNYNVTDVVFPTAWGSELPFLTGIQAQAMWSEAMSVTLLASGYSNPKSGKYGSGIYNNGPLNYMSTLESSSLSVVAEIDTPSTPIITQITDQLVPYYWQENLTNYRTQLVSPNITNYELCHDNLCCNVEIVYSLNDETALRIIVYNGARTFGGGIFKDMYLQTCGVVRCNSSGDHVTNCGFLLNNGNNITIERLKIQGNFDKTAIIGPNFVDGNLAVLTKDEYYFSKLDDSTYSLEINETLNANMLTLALWGRNFVTATVEHSVTNAPYIVMGTIASVQAQSSWSFSNKMNLLASGFNRPSGGSTGSGVYVGHSHTALSFYMADVAKSFSLVSTLEAEDNQHLIRPYDNSYRELYLKKDDLSEYASMLLSPVLGSRTTVNLCHGKICCELTYQLVNVTDTFYYQLLAYDGVRTHANKQYPSKLKVCALIACFNEDKNSCNENLKYVTYSNDTIFNYLQIKGNFTNDLVWPNTLNANSLGPIEYVTFTHESFNFELTSVDEELSSVHTFALWSHDYEPYTANSVVLAPFLMLVSIMFNILMFTV